MAELMLKIEKQHSAKSKSDYSDRFLFPGQSCFPLSQCAEAKQTENQDTNTVSINDQLIKILKVIGKQAEDQLTFIKEESIVNYTQSLQDSVDLIQLDAKFPHVNKDLVEFLKKLLIFNPKKRPSAKECLENSIFENLRVKQLEQDADIKITLELDDLDLFDYEECTDNLQVDKCLAMLAQEIEKFKESKGKRDKQGPAAVPDNVSME